MLGTSFTSGQHVALACVGMLVVAAVVLQSRKKPGVALVLLTLAALGLRLFAATLDPFLHQWDECFHAVVARNMTVHPFTPMLHMESAMPVTGHWMEAHVWLHKPPFFLWQMAASVQLFGAEPWAVRIPSVLWLTALVPVGYRIARLLANAEVAWATALFLTFSYYMEELAAGAIGTDHNDAVFIATVACSWWALLELWNDGRRRWVVLAGFFSACAILTKWSAGLSVFLPWGIVVAMHGFRRREMVDLTLGAAIALVLAGAWIASIVVRFPIEAAHEWSFKAGHLSRAMDAHSGGWDYHFDAIREVLPPFSPWYVLPAFAWLLWKAERKEHRVFLIALFVAVHLVFAVAQTKMVSYTMELFPLYLIALSRAVTDLMGMLSMKYRSWAISIGVPLLAIWMLDLPRLHQRHTVAAPSLPDQRWRQQQLQALEPLAQLEGLVANERPVAVFHVPALHHMQFMFNTGQEAWDRIPDQATVDRLIARGYMVYVVQDGLPSDRFPHRVVLIADSVLRFPDVGRPE